MSMYEEFDSLEELDEEEESEVVRKLYAITAAPAVCITKDHIYWNTEATKFLGKARSVKYEISKNYIYLTPYEKERMDGTFAVWSWGRKANGEDIKGRVTSFPIVMRNCGVPLGVRKLYKCKDKFAIKRYEIMDC